MSRLTITIPDVIHNRISILANEANESMSTIINKLIIFGLNYDGNPLASNSLVEEHCQPHQEYVPVQFTPPAGFPPLSMIEARVGGALVYRVEVERFLQF